MIKKKIKNPFKVLKSRVIKKSADTEYTNYDKNDNEDQVLIESIKDAKSEWITADSNFQNVIESEFIEYYTYKLKAAQIKYEFFLKKAKEKGININSVNSTFSGINNINTNTNTNTNINTNTNTNVNTSTEAHVKELR